MNIFTALPFFFIHLERLLSYTAPVTNDLILCTQPSTGFLVVNQQDILQLNQTSLIFHLKTCVGTNAKVVLSANVDFAAPFHKLSLSNTDNTFTRIWACQAENACSHQNTNTSTVRMVKPTEFRSLWMAWQGYAMTMGTGSVIGQNILMTNDYASTETIRYIGIKSQTCASQWIFKKEKEPNDLIGQKRDTFTFGTPVLFTLSADDRVFDLVTENFECELSSTTETSMIMTKTVELTSVGLSTIHLTSKVPPSNSEATSVSETSIMTTAGDICFCSCNQMSDYINLTSFELLEYLDDIKSYLKVNPKSTSSYKSKLISASDSRVSATAIGWFGIFIVKSAFYYEERMDRNYINGNLSVNMVMTSTELSSTPGPLVCLWQPAPFSKIPQRFEGPGMGMTWEIYMCCRGIPTLERKMYNVEIKGKFRF